MKKFILFLLVISSLHVKGQIYHEGGLGVEAIYNIPVEGIGVAVRYQYHLTNTFVIVPKVDYYLPMNDVHELLAGLDIQARIMSWRTWGFYVLAGPYYNHWINYDESPLSDAKASNFAVEGGVGFGLNYGCIRPFAEYRYNSKWEESNARLGVVFYFKDCSKSASCPPFYK